MDSSEINGILTGQSTNVEPTQLLLSPLSIAAVEEWLHLCEYDERVPYLAGRIHEESKGILHSLKKMLKGLRNKMSSPAITVHFKSYSAHSGHRFAFTSQRP